MTEINTKRTWIIGSRGSQLALWQANHISDSLTETTTIEVIKTEGDLVQDRPLQGGADKGFFTKEIEQALLDNRIDIAVHSLKDLQSQLPEGLILGAVTQRAAVPDYLLVHPDAVDLDQPLPIKPGSKIGATSLRRQALLRRYYPELEPTMLRGNVPTRVKKLKNKEYDAIVIAKAGLERLGIDLSGLEVLELNPEVWIPAAGQAALGIEVRQTDGETLCAIAPLKHDETWRAVWVERQLLAKFEAGCHTAFGAWARPDGDGMQVLVGAENDKGVWLAAEVHEPDETRAMEAAWEKLQRIMLSGVEEDSWEQPLYRVVAPSF